MTDRERLIELLKGAETNVNETLSYALSLDEWLGIYADHLLANGVIVPPDDAIMYVKDNWLMLNVESKHLGEAINQCVKYLTKNAKECEKV